MLATYLPGEFYEQGTIRIQFMSYSIRLTDCQNAGKRGQKCRFITIQTKQFQPVESITIRNAAFGLPVKLESVTNLYTMNLWLIEVLERMGGIIDIHREELKAVDVKPIGVEDYHFSSPKLGVFSTLNRYSISDLEDTANEGRAISCNDTKANIKKFWKWCRDNEERFCLLSFQQFLNLAKQETGIRYHHYYAMD